MDVEKTNETRVLELDEYGSNRDTLYSAVGAIKIDGKRKNPVTCAVPAHHPKPLGFTCLRLLESNE